ncbi:unnamed protein product [Blepharisma stoltei]|uniref:Mevalonate kinase n=1 Tax=Blepharisma stoltei TaxID=1481888 RepID=A0AAU9JWA1_9CILI|nr:unnamed protein product [Blepharisma stoltei]
MSKITATAPTKVILTGEHAVVYGKQAIGAALNLPTTVSLTIHSNSSNPGICLEMKEQFFYISWEEAAERRGEISTKGILSLLTLKVYPENPTDLFEYKIDISLPLGCGLGTSASLCVAVSGVLLKSKNPDATPEQINNLAFEGENCIHGKASGIDNTIVTYGGILSFKDGQITPVEFDDSKAKILLVSSGVPKNTGKMVKGVANQLAMYPGLTEGIFHSIDCLSKNLVTALEAQQYDHVKELLKINHGLLWSLGVSSELLNDIVNTGLKYGIKGKLTGAGGGGFCLFFVTDEDTAGFLQECASHGWNVIEASLTHYGIKFELS